jgi:chromosome segregation ATPase
VIEAGMYFALGLATAGLLALMIAPMLWRRAAARTRSQIEHAVPRTLGEIQADKDQLRAEFAMSTRRLETSVERLRLKAGEHLAEINEKRELLKRLAEEQANRIKAVEELEAREGELQKVLQRREERLSDTAAELDAVRSNLAERGRALEQLERTLKRANETAEEKTVELVVKGTEIDNLRDQIAAAKSRQTALQVERTRLETELAEARTIHAVEVQKVESQDRRIARADELLKSQVAELADRAREIEHLNADIAAKATTIATIEQRLTEAAATQAETAAQVARLTLSLEEAGRRDRTTELNGIVTRYEEERVALDTRVASLKEENATLRAENAELQKMAGAEWEAERTQNALLRERLNDIASDVSKLTRNYNGEHGLAELAALAGPANEPGAAAPKPPGKRGRQANRSLTDRVRALQRTVQG